MYITFKNNSINDKMIITIENQKHIIDPNTTVDIFCNGEKIGFVAQTCAFDELGELTDEIDSDVKSFKDRILTKLAKKLVEKMTELVLNVSLKYEVRLENMQDKVINLYDGIYSVCDGKIADILDLTPVGIVFVRAEVETGQIKVVDANPTNRKKFLKVTRNFLLWSHQWFFSIDWFLFVPEYSLARHYSSQRYLKKLFSGFYGKPSSEREKLFAEKEAAYEKEEKNEKGCLKGFIIFLIVIAVLVGIVFWGMTSDPDVIVSEDFETVVCCFDETFERIETGLPQDAKKVFLEEFYAYYVLPDGEYDMDNYYCYIYEDSAGERYMWLKDGCSDESNEDKDYYECEKPLVYKSVGEQTE